MRSLGGDGLRLDDVDGLAAALAAELDRTRDEREQRVVAATADAVTGRVPPAQFNDAVDKLNDARSHALDLCDATY